MSATKIEWASVTWNPTTGCSHVSVGCDRCYAERFATRLRGRSGYPRDDSFSVVLHPERMNMPSRWKKPRRVFVDSMGDLFHPEVPDGFIMWVWWVMVHNPQHIYMILTKRPKRMLDWFARWTDLGGKNGFMQDPVLARGPDAIRESHKNGRALLFADMLDLWGQPPEGAAYPIYDWMERVVTWPDALPNVWLGVTAENQATADERIPLLCDSPADMRFVSCEPLLGPINIGRWLTHAPHVPRCTCFQCHRFLLDPVNCGLLDWVIAGGENGHGARPCHPGWVRSLRDACKNNNDTPFLFKGWGAWAPGEAVGNSCYGYASGDGKVGFTAGREPKRYSFDSDDRYSGRVCAWHVGKKKSGRFLDGNIHHRFPDKLELR